MRLARILTCASSVFDRLPRTFVPVACRSDLGAHSCGAVAEFHRASQYQTIVTNSLTGALTTEQKFTTKPESTPVNNPIAIWHITE